MSCVIGSAPLVVHSQVKAKPCTTVEQNPLTGIKVLIADDAIDNQVLIRHLLQTAGAATTFVDNGSEAVQAAMAEHFDVILMDIQMPVMDGLEATRTLRSQGYTKPIIALTAHAMREDRERCMNAGCDDHLTKPIDRSALINAVALAAEGKFGCLST